MLGVGGRVRGVCDGGRQTVISHRARKWVEPALRKFFSVKKNMQTVLSLNLSQVIKFSCLSANG